MIKAGTVNNDIQAKKIFETLKEEGFPGGYNTVMDYLGKEYRKQKGFSAAGI